MKANEFVKKHGWEAVINAVNGTTSEETAFFESTDLDPILSNDGSTIGFNVKVHQIKYDEVKRLVESHEYIESYGGLIESKRTFEMRHGVINLDGWDKLKQAIADVESCQ